MKRTLSENLDRVIPEIHPNVQGKAITYTNVRRTRKISSPPNGTFLPSEMADSPPKRPPYSHPPTRGSKIDDCRRAERNLPRMGPSTGVSGGQPDAVIACQAFLINRVSMHPSTPHSPLMHKSRLFFSRCLSDRSTGVLFADVPFPQTLSPFSEVASFSGERFFLRLCRFPGFPPPPPRFLVAPLTSDFFGQHLSPVIS